MHSEQNIKVEIAKIKNLPPLPEASIKIINAVNNPDVDMDELVDVLSLSPVLMARLLGLANSAYFGRSGTISSLRVAIIQVLGLRLVKSLSLSIVLNVELDDSQCKLFDANLFWNHSLLTAIIAQKLSAHIDDELIESGVVYTAGLLLDIGLLAAVYIFPQQVNKMFANIKKDADSSLSQQMQDELGLTQYEVGALLLDAWQLPVLYQTLAKEFRNTEFEGKEKKFILLLDLSQSMATFIINDQDSKPADFDDLLTKLSINHELLQELITDIVKNKDNINELAKIISG